jgi:CRISPR-associated endonuclease/helicase Cas3
MVQRLGRVNRRGQFARSLVDVLAAMPDKEAEDSAEPEQLAWWRAPIENRSWKIDAEGRREASPYELLRLKVDPELHPIMLRASTPAPLHPALTEPLVEAWAMTSLPAHPGRPLVEPWLRGWIEKRPQTRIAWRRHIEARERPSRASRG